MARRKKNGKRSTGIQGKNGHLYIILSETIIENGIKKTVKKWISTGLADTPDNIKKASELRGRLINKKTLSLIDRNISITEYMDLVLEKKRRVIAETTYAAYYHKINRIKNFFGDIKVREINEIYVAHFLDDLFETYHLQLRYVKDIKSIFSNVMEEAVKDGIISYNPVKEVAINKNLSDKYAKPKKIDDLFFSFDEAMLFLKRIKDHKLFEVFYLTLFFGLRRGEILGLKWSAIDFKNRTMIINHTVTKGLSGVNRNNTTKTVSSTRKYPLTYEQVELFKQLKKKENENRRLFGRGYYESDYIFKNEDGTLYHPDTLSKEFKKIILNNPDLPQDITLHGLRISCVSILIQKESDVKKIQEWVGHADLDTTLKIYAKVKEKASKLAVSDTMNDILPLSEFKDLNQQPDREHSLLQ